MWSAVGKVSLEDCERFTESLGCRACSPAMRFPIWAMTSFTFMLVWVPEPVCHTLSGKAPAWAPDRISSAAAQMSSALAGSSTPSSALATAAQRLRTANARITSGGMVSVPILKFSRLRWVWAPHGASAGTRTSPMESCSIR